MTPASFLVLGARGAADELRQKSLPIVLKDGSIILGVGENLVGQDIRGLGQIFGTLVDPARNHRGRYFEVELQSINIFPYAKGLILIIDGRGEPNRSRWQLKAIAMPLKDCGVFRQIAKQGIHLAVWGNRDRTPADFFDPSVINRRAQGDSNQLCA